MNIKEKFPEISEEITKFVEENYVTLDDYKRTAADFENARKRIINQNEILLQGAKDKVFIEISEFIDIFDIALKNSTDKDGINMLRDKFVNYLKSKNIEVFYPIHEIFDSEKHEVIATVSMEEDPGTIIEVSKPGLIKDNKVIRPAKVIVEA